MKILAYSDAHGRLPTIPAGGDVVILSGDMLPNFSHNKRVDTTLQLEWLANEFIDWAWGITAGHIIITAGNHDTCFEDNIVWTRKILENDKRITVLIDEAIIIDGVKFYGSPWVNPVGNWSFLADTGKMAIVRDIIPLDTNVLVCHSPPYGILDMAYNQNLGCKHLLKKLDHLNNLGLMTVGHIHECGGKVFNRGKVHIMNTAGRLMEFVL